MAETQGKTRQKMYQMGDKKYFKAMNEIQDFRNEWFMPKAF